MCLIALAWRAHPRYRLVLVGNRDEFHARPTLPLAAWQDQPAIVGGRDAVHGGGWLAMRGRRLATVTNVRRLPEQQGRSRGELVADFVRGDADAASALNALAHTAADYRPFNLLMHDGDMLAFATNTQAFATHVLAPGVHGISNGALDALWPKTAHTMARVSHWLALRDRETPELEPLFAALADTRIASDGHLPDTGIGIERERFLSPAFIAHATYGTRASTVVLIADDHAQIVERRFGAEAIFLGETKIHVSFPD